MVGFKYLIFVLPCLLHILHVVSSEEKFRVLPDKLRNLTEEEYRYAINGDINHSLAATGHEQGLAPDPSKIPRRVRSYKDYPDYHAEYPVDDPRYVPAKVTSIEKPIIEFDLNAENIKPVALDVLYKWWKSIPLDFSKFQSKYEKPEDHSEIDKILKENITPVGFEQLQEWWLSCPTFNMLSSKLFSKDENQAMAKDDIHEYMTYNGFRKMSGEDYEKMMHGDVSDNLKPIDTLTPSTIPNRVINREDFDDVYSSAYGSLPRSGYNPEPSSRYDPYSYQKPKRRRSVISRDDGYGYDGY